MGWCWFATGAFESNFFGGAGLVRATNARSNFIGLLVITQQMLLIQISLVNKLVMAQQVLLIQISLVLMLVKTQQVLNSQISLVLMLV
jgi:hypothetical protein